MEKKMLSGENMTTLAVIYPECVALQVAANYLRLCRENRDEKFPDAFRFCVTAVFLKVPACHRNGISETAPQSHKITFFFLFLSFLFCTT